MAKRDLMKIKLFLVVSLIVIVGNLTAEPLPLDFFTKKSSYKSIKLSPDGKHFAAAVPIGDQTSLVILNREAMKPTYIYRFGSNEHVDEYYWVNNERLVFTRNIQEVWREQPVSYGQIYAGNIDGTEKAVIFGFQGGNNQTASRTRKNSGADRSWGDILHTLPDEPNHIIISARRMDNKYDSPVRIIKLNVYNSRKKVIARTPLGNMNVFLDSNGKPVIARGTDSRGKQRQYLYNEREWQEIKKDDLLSQYDAVSVNSAGTKLYLLGYPEGKTESLYEYEISSKKLTKIFQHPISDMSSIIRKPEVNTVVGVKVMPGTFEYHYIDPNDEFTKLHSSLAKAFSGQDITITSRTKDLKEMVVFARSDKNPGDFYLFNNEKKSAEFLFSQKQWIDPQLMSERKPIQFQSRDGKLIHGYLTLPINHQNNLPLVTYVHGGPYGVQDEWWYDSTSQMLANNGYAVLQVNYRGSSGYGLEYEEVAYRKRSTLIQEDIIDGTQWAMSLPEVAKNKACIMGWSFGGYSAVMAPLIEPDLFKCSIAAAGVYDAIEQEEDADYSEISSVAADAAKVYGSDEVLLKKESPLTYIDKLKIPILIVHGGEDKRVPPAQAFLLKEALDKRNMPYEWLFKEKEGHGFYNEDNQKEFYEKTLLFLNKHLN